MPPPAVHTRHKIASKSPLWPLWVALLIAADLYGQEVTIASWNIRIFSTGSRDDTELELIADRLQQFDLIAIQETRDLDVVERTLAILETRGFDYDGLVTQGVGRSPQSTERYTFLWRIDTVDLIDRGAFFPDTEDWFIREPYYASFRAGAFDCTLINIHSIFGNRVADRRAEAERIDEVYHYVQDLNTSEQDVLFLGDFNMASDDRSFSETRALLAPVFDGDTYTNISEKNPAAP